MSVFGPQNANAATALPAGSSNKRYKGQSWVKDATGPGAADGTVLDAAFYNRIIGNLEYLVSQAGISAQPGDFTAIYRSVIAVVSKGANAALDTIKELGDALNNDAHFGATVINALASRLRFDAPQSLTSSQKAQARSNIGVSAVATTGSYSDLNNKPVLGTAASHDIGIAPGNVVALDADAKLPALDGSQLTAVAATSVPWTGVTGKPTFFSGSYADLTDKPTLFDGTYASLTGKPTLFDGAYASLSGKPTLGTAAALSVGTSVGNVVQVQTGGKLPALDGSALTGLPAAFSGNYADLAGKPTLGTAAALNVGTSVGNVVQVQTGGKLPALDGSLLTGIGSATLNGLIAVNVYTSSQTITVPAGATRARVHMAGGSGGAQNWGTGGAAPGALMKWLTGLTPGNTLVFTRGAAGAATPTAGGASTLASGTQTIATLTANGGGVGNGGTNGGMSTGGTASGGDINITGQSGMSSPVDATPTLYPAQGGVSGFGLVKGADAVGVAGEGGILIVEWFS